MLSLGQRALNYSLAPPLNTIVGDAPLNSLVSPLRTIVGSLAYLIRPLAELLAARQKEGARLGYLVSLRPLVGLLANPQWCC